MSEAGTILILSSQDLQTVMRFDDYVDAVAEAFRMLAEGRCESPVPLQVSVTDGTFHAKAASLPVGSGYVAVKVNGNFPDNRSRHGLPTIQGAVFLADANNGRPLALLNSIEITRQRTAAATAVATQYLARPDSRTATICGCGEQGRIQLRALRHKLDLTQVFAWDIDSQTSRRFSAEMAAELGIDVTAIDDLREGTLVSDNAVANGVDHDERGQRTGNKACRECKEASICCGAMVVPMPDDIVEQPNSDQNDKGCACAST